MKICAACHADLPKDSYSKKQWKLDKCHRRCKVCVTNNRAVQPIQKQDSDDQNTNEVIKSLDSICLENVEKISDEKLFKQPPPAEDCPICFIRLPTLITGRIYMVCCGKVICKGCCCAPLFDDQGNEVDNEKCPFCRTPSTKTNEEMIKRLKKRVEANDPVAIHDLGCDYRNGHYGLPQDYSKALELFQRAGKLGYANAYSSIGIAYFNGQGVETDMKKAMHYYELAAMGGSVEGRYNLGDIEATAGNIDITVKHWMISVGCGDNESLKEIKELYSNGYATKEDYTQALQSYQTYLDEIKSPQRDKASATYENCRYY